MSSIRIIVTGTDTGIGKTIFAAALTQALGACYWKPIQAGLGEKTDSEHVLELAGMESSRVLPEAYRLDAHLSPHRAAELEGVRLNPANLELPPVAGPLVVEGAGGVLVPITRSFLFADLFARWGAPVVLVARTALGTINHSLLSIGALRERGIRLLGIAFVGDAQEDSEATIAELGKVHRLGRLPLLDPITPATLADAFAANFKIADFTS